MVIKNLTKLHCKDVAKIHFKSFPGFFLTSLGENFLYSFYKAVVKNKDSKCIGLFEHDNLIGFAIGSKTNGSFYKKVFLQSFLQLATAAFIPLMKQPKYILQLIFSLLSLNKVNFESKNYAILLSICVNPKHESKGYGKKLINEFEKIIFESSTTIILTTDADNNSHVNNFYLRNGYLLKTDFYQGQRKMNLYYKLKDLL
jgi:ribosomal protein S18 acetylase RimI-like enzyme